MKILDLELNEATCEAYCNAIDAKCAEITSVADYTMGPEWEHYRPLQLLRQGFAQLLYLAQEAAGHDRGYKAARESMRADFDPAVGPMQAARKGMAVSDQIEDNTFRDGWVYACREVLAAADPLNVLMVKDDAPPS